MNRIEDMGKVLKLTTRANEVLRRYWSDKIALVWTVQDVYVAANERGRAVTKAQAIQILQHFSNDYDKLVGMCWEDLTSYIEEQEMGRKLTKTELRRFVHNNLLTIDRK